MIFDKILTFIIILFIFLCFLTPIIEFIDVVIKSFKGIEPEETYFEKIFKDVIGFNPLGKD